MATPPQLAPSPGLVVDSAPETSSAPSTRGKIVPRRRGQQGRVYKRGKRWVGLYREYEVDPQTGKRTRRTITFDESVTSRLEALDALRPYLDAYNAKAKANIKSSPPQKRGCRTLANLIE